jgi:hypothetical protein
MLLGTKLLPWLRGTVLEHRSLTVSLTTCALISLFILQKDVIPVIYFWPIYINLVVSKDGFSQLLEDWHILQVALLFHQSHHKPFAIAEKKLHSAATLKYS